MVARALAARGDQRKVITDPAASCAGAEVDDESLVPLGAARLGATHFADWTAGA